MDDIQLAPLNPHLDASADTRAETNLGDKPHYIPLLPKHIRVLEILPLDAESDPDASPIVTKLRIINLENNPSFTALSYVWGTYALVPDFITCENVQFRVTSNCYFAIKHLRKKLGAFTIWVDAVCINQDDRKEKETQIPLMGEIYTLSAVVYVWLGEGSSGKDRAMAYLSKAWIEQYHNSIESRPYHAAFAILLSRFSRTTHLFPMRLMKRRFKLPLKGDHASIDDLYELLSSSWITRLWTLQEILLASNPIVVCGDSHLSWYHIERSLIFLELSPLFKAKEILRDWTVIIRSRDRLRNSIVASSISESTEMQSLCQFVTKVTTVWKRLLVCLLYMAVVVLVIAVILFATEHDLLYNIALVCCGLACSFLVVLSMLHFFPEIRSTMNLTLSPHIRNEDLTSALYGRKAAFPMDMAYGMWAILERGGANLPTPNYSHDIGEIYRFFTVQLIHFTHTLNTIYIAALKPSAGQPSWVPDWSSAGNHNWLGISSRESYDEHGYYRAQSRWHNALADFLPIDRLTSIAQEPSPSYFDPTETVLTLRARKVGQIHACLLFQQTHENEIEDENDIHLENLRLMLVAASDVAPFASFIRSVLGRRKYDVFPNTFILLIKDDSSRSRWRELQTRKWVSFCAQRCHKDLQESFALLQADQELFLSQIRLCNLLANQSTSCFLTRFRNRPDVDVWGQSVRQVRAGDWIARIEGVHHLMIFRDFIEGVAKAVKLVGLLLLINPEENVRRRFQGSFKDIPLEEYNVY